MQATGSHNLSKINNVSFSRNVPVRHTVDVFIAGGGPAGVAAAVTAARQGLQVYLAEGHTCFGGMGTAGLLPMYMPFTDGINFLAGGIGEEIFTRLENAGGTARNYPKYQYNTTYEYLHIKSEVLKRLYDDMMLESGANFTFQTSLIDVQMSGDTVEHVILSAKSGIFAVKANIYIDCTGDGDLAAMAGALFEKGDEQGRMMAGTLCSAWSGIHWDQVKDRDGRRLEEAFEDGILKVEDRHLPGMYRVGKQLGTGNIGHAYGLDATDEESLTKAFIEERKKLLEYEVYYKEYLKGFQDMELVTSASLMGVRETRRITGDYVLNIDDYQNRAVFDDEIGRYNWLIDLHAAAPDKESYQNYYRNFTQGGYKKGDSYGIPYRILTPGRLTNVLTAGRCVSTDRYVLSSLRVMPGCYITGQAAGMAALVAVEKNTHTRGFAVSEVQKKLKSVGAYLPNFKEV